MRAPSRFVIFLGLLVATMVAPGRAQVIGIFADSTGTRCDLSAHPGTPGHGYLGFRKGALEGIAGWACRVQGLPSGWIGTSGAQPPVPVTNDLFGDGAVWAWPTCQHNDPIVLAPLTITATSEQQDVVLSVTPRIPLVNPALECALVAQCDAPVYTAVCVAVQSAIVNATTPCVVAVEARSWTQIRRLYD